MENHGDYNEEYLGEGYDQKFGWEELVDNPTKEEIAVLDKFGILLK